ncbi:MAG: ankyrin repeat domain-containing protein [Endozoicomonas sp.]
MDSTGTTKGYSCFSSSADQQFLQWLNQADRHSPGLKVRLASLGNYIPLMNERSYRAPSDTSLEKRSVKHADQLQNWLEKSFHNFLLRFWYTHGDQEQHLIYHPARAEVFSWLLCPLQKQLQQSTDSTSHEFQHASALIDALAADSNTADSCDQLFDNLNTLKPHLLPGYDESIDTGLCHGLSASYIQAALLSTSLKDMAPLEAFSNRMQLLSRNPDSGWFFFGEHCTDLKQAISKAQTIYWTFQLQKPGGFYDTFALEEPEAFQLLELRPWLEQVIQCQHPSTTALACQNRASDIARNLSLTPSLKLDTVCKTADTLSSNHSEAVIRTNYTPVATDHAELESFLCKLPVGHYTLSTSDHEIALSVDAEGFTLFDQNIPSYFLQTGRENTTQFASELMRSINVEHPKSYCVFAISGYFINSETGRKEKKNTEDQLNMLALCQNHQPSVDKEVCSTPSGCTPLFLGAYYGNLDFVRSRLKSNPEELNITDSEDRSPLSVAAANGHYDSVALLLEYHTDLQQCTKKGASLMFCAAESGNAHIVELLLQHHADINKADRDGLTPLRQAVQNGHKEAAKVLLKHGANPKLCDHDGNSPLHAAAQNGDTEIISLLLDNSADIDQLSKTHCPPLYRAVCARQAKAVELLLKMGASPTLGCTEAGSPLSAAEKLGYTEIVEIFSKYSPIQ